jgi:hypothetical protein
VLAFEVPKVMHSGGSSSSTTSTTAASTPAATVTPTAPAAGTISPAQVQKDLKAIDALPSKDPFQAQLASNPTSSQGLQTPATPPHVRASDFVSKDPFKAQISAGGTATTATPPIATPQGPAVTPTRPSGKRTGTSYIVILRSLDTKAAGLSEVKKARKHGLTSASLLYSSKYTTLRHGYWVVYLSTYSSASAANSGLQLAHAHGYGSAYRRPVRK